MFGFGKGEGGGTASPEASPASRSAAERNVIRQTAGSPARGEALGAGRLEVHEGADEEIVEENEREAA